MIHNCFACGIDFDITFEDEDATVNYCPYCGSEFIRDDVTLTDDLTFIEDEFDYIR
jgi:predicted RNA-binding Zn-ribbon protein involved in translation (DUF1610 family)